MKVAFVMVAKTLNCIGGLRVAAIAKKQGDADVYFIIPNNWSSLSHILYPNRGSTLSSSDFEIISKKLAFYDIICFSSLTDTISDVFEITGRLKKINKKAFVLLGGIHATLYPDGTIDKVDAICVGEGEKPIRQFLEAFKDEKDYYNIKGLWFNKNGDIHKNQSGALNTNEELNEFQMGLDVFDCQIYDVRQKQFVDVTKNDFIKFNGLTYCVMWTMGCPFSCSYCSNSGFVKIDKNYAKLRFSKPEIVVREIEEVIKKRPFISSVAFADDNMIALPFDVLEEFCKLYKSKIDLPFFVGGIHPNTINKEKIELLASYGMIKTRLGIQSGSEKVLKLYERNTPLEAIISAVNILADAQRKYHMMPPFYDIICDNPIETRDDIISSLRLLNSLKRPLLLNVFALRVLPGTKLASCFEENGINCSELSYHTLRPTLSNLMIYLISFAKIPDFIFERLLRKVKGNDTEQKKYPILFGVFRFLSRLKRAVYMIRASDFAEVPCKRLFISAK